MYGDLTQDIVQSVLCKTKENIERQLLNRYDNNLSFSPAAPSTDFFPWLAETRFFAKIINGQQDAFTDDIPLQKNQKGHLLIITPSPLSTSNYSFVQDSDRTSILYTNIKHYLNACHGGNIFIIRENRLCIWINSAPSKMTDSLSELDTICLQIKSLFSQAGLCNIAFQRSESEIVLSDFAQGYRAVDSLCQYRFFVSDDVILCDSWLRMHSVDIANNDLQTYLCELSHSLELGEENSFLACLHKIFEKTTQSLSFNCYAYIWGQLMFWYYSQLQRYHLSPEQYSLSSSHNSFSHITLAFEALSAELLQLFQILKTSSTGYQNPHIEHALSYMDANFTKQLSLSDVAKEIHISPSYLSHLFQTELGKTFVTIRNQLKIEKAKQLLKMNYKVYEVAHLVGFENDKYFSKVFFNFVGTSPSQYVKQGVLHETR